MAIRSSTANNKRRQVEYRQGLLQRRTASHGIRFGICALLVVITLAVFGQTVRYEFVNFDDDLYVYNTPAIRSGITLKGTAAAFVSQHAHNWHPLTTISHMLDCQLYGLNAGGHHATNVILHTIAVLLLFWVLQGMTGATWRSALVAALFAVHPLHVESVAWVSERKDILSAVFFFLMLHAYTRYARAPSVIRYLAVALLFAAGLMSKPMLVSAPIILLLLDYWPLGRFEQPSLITGKIKASESDRQRRNIRRIYLEKIPLFLFSGAASILTFALQKRTAGAIPPLPFLWRIQNAFVSYVVYIWKTLWPARLAVFYPHPNDTLALWEVTFAIAVVAGNHCGSDRFSKTTTLSVNRMVLVSRYAYPGDRHYPGWRTRPCRPLHLPSSCRFVCGGGLVCDRRRNSSPIQTTGGSDHCSCGLIVLALAWAAFIQASYWRDSGALWTHALAVTSDNDVAHNNLGYLCNDRGELDKAISHFESAARIRSAKRDPHYDLASAFVQMNLGDALARKGRSDEAMVHYDEAITLQPDYADAYYNRGTVLLAKGRVDEAIADLAKALEMHPYDADAHTSLGNALLQKGSPREAIAHT